jgi:hypothetical protein
MITASTKFQCPVCKKETSTFNCDGCSQKFCFNDLNKLPQLLDEQFGHYLPSARGSFSFLYCLCGLQQRILQNAFEIAVRPFRTDNDDLIKMEWCHSLIYIYTYNSKQSIILNW